MLGGFWRGAVVGAAYAVAALLLFLVADDPAEVVEDPYGSVIVLTYIAAVAGSVGASCGAIAGCVGGGVLGVLAEIGIRGRRLAAAAAVLGAALGWFAVDLAAAMGAGPDVDSSLTLLFWRAGPAAAGAAGALWQAARTH
jgi:hypothetical protein